MGSSVSHGHGQNSPPPQDKQTKHEFSEKRTSEASTLVETKGSDYRVWTQRGRRWPWKRKWHKHTWLPWPGGWLLAGKASIIFLLFLFPVPPGWWPCGTHRGIIWSRTEARSSGLNPWCQAGIPLFYSSRISSDPGIRNSPTVRLSVGPRKWGSSGSWSLLHPHPHPPAVSLGLSPGEGGKRVRETDTALFLCNSKQNLYGTHGKRDSIWEVFFQSGMHTVNQLL